MNALYELGKVAKAKRAEEEVGRHFPIDRRPHGFLASAVVALRTAWKAVTTRRRPNKRNRPSRG
jgi:hypothetical protein